MAIEQLSKQSLSRQALEDGVRDVISNFLLKTGQTPKAPNQPDAPIFERECWVEAYRRGYDMTHLSKHLHVGILVSNAAYFYQSFEIRLYIAYYTGLMLCIDDNFDIQSEGIARFMERYQRGERHPTDVLNNVADLLSETATFFDPVATNLIMCASFSFMNAMVIEHITAGMEVRYNFFFPSSTYLRQYYSFLRQRNGTLIIYVCSLASLRPTLLLFFDHQSVLPSTFTPSQNSRISSTTSSKSMVLLIVAIFIHDISVI